MWVHHAGEAVHVCNNTGPCDYFTASNIDAPTIDCPSFEPIFKVINYLTFHCTAHRFAVIVMGMCRYWGCIWWSVMSLTSLPTFSFYWWQSCAQYRHSSGQLSRRRCSSHLSSTHRGEGKTRKASQRKEWCKGARREKYPQAYVKCQRMYSSSPFVTLTASSLWTSW